MSFELFVNGTLMRGLELHGNLEGAEFLGEAQTAPTYRVYSIDDRHPGMFEVGAGGVSVKGELYLVDEALWARIEAGEPPHLYRGEGDAIGRQARPGRPLPTRAGRRPAPGHFQVRKLACLFGAAKRRLSSAY